jgi:hypothetical protein
LLDRRQGRLLLAHRAGTRQLRQHRVDVGVLQALVVTGGVARRLRAVEPIVIQLVGSDARLRPVLGELEIAARDVRGPGRYGLSDEPVSNASGLVLPTFQQYLLSIDSFCPDFVRADSAALLDAYAGNCTSETLGLPSQ